MVAKEINLVPLIQQQGLTIKKRRWMLLHHGDSIETSRNYTASLQPANQIQEHKLHYERSLQRAGLAVDSPPQACLYPMQFQKPKASV